MIQGWHILELFGHVSHVGIVSEVEAFGGKLCRIDALQRDGSFVTHHVGAGAIYRLTPTTEEAARERMKPFSTFAYAAPLPITAHVDGDLDEADDDDLTTEGDA